MSPCDLRQKYPACALTSTTPARSPEEAAGAKRKLAAVLSADVAGFSRLMGVDEAGTHRTLTAYRAAMDDVIGAHWGRVVGTAGDSVLADFGSVVEALQAAVDIQRALGERNAALPPERRLEFRIGINLGDVIVDDADIYGDGVNVAARIQALAEPGGIAISGAVYEQVRGTPRPTGPRTRHGPPTLSGGCTRSSRSSRSWSSSAIRLIARRSGRGCARRGWSEPVFEGRLR